LIPDNCDVEGLITPGWKPLPSRDVTRSLPEICLDEWQWLIDVLNFAILPQASLEPRCFKPGETIEMRLAPTSGSALFAILSSELLAAVVRAKAFYSCFGCGTWFSPETAKHKPRTGEHAYCPDCGPKTAERDAQRRRRKRMRAARQLKATGLSMEEIAKHIGSKRETVGKWLKDT
jgi:hypothetical protein